ncbi:hypothetical protein NFI96_007421 [Prochilodus magdalenae]|nr:hypothetical protein NFI96_007421 [Prochilodus magdalenae]
MRVRERESAGGEDESERERESAGGEDESERERESAGGEDESERERESAGGEDERVSERERVCQQVGKMRVRERESQQVGKMRVRERESQQVGKTRESQTSPFSLSTSVMAERRLVLEGLPDDLDSVVPKLELYFRNKRRSGGEVIRIQEHPEDRRKALLIYPREAGSEGDPRRRSLLVRSTGSVDEDTLTLYFEQFSEQTEITQRGENSWIIDLANHSDLMNVLAVKEHDFGFSVEEYKEHLPEKLDPRRFILTGFKDTCNYKLVTLFISSCSKKARHSWEPLDEDRIAVTFKEDIDVNNFLIACTTKKLQGMEITASQLELTASVLVQGDMIRIKEDLLTEHFSNRMKSGGGDIKSLLWIDKQTSVVITFKDGHAAYRVVEQRHRLCGEDLTVLLFYLRPRLTLTGETPILSGIQTTIPVNMEILNFLENHEQCKHDLQGQLKMVHATVLFDKTTFQREIVVEMDLDKDSLAALRIGPTWEKKAKKAAQKFLVKLSVDEVAVEDKVWKSVESKCLTLITPEADIFFRQTGSKIVVVGLAEVVSALVDKIKNLVKMPSVSLALDRKTIAAVVQGNPSEKIPLKSVREMEFIESYMNLLGIPEIRNLGISLGYACDTPSTPCLNVTAAEDKIQDAVRVVKKQVSSIVVEKLTYSKPGESKVLQKNEANVKATAKEWHCRLYFEHPGKAGPPKTFRHRINSSTTLTIAEGDLPQYTADALICPMSTSLAFENHTAQQFLKTGGSQIQEVCNKLQKEKRSLAGKAVLSNPGNLRTKTLIYAVLPPSRQTLSPHYLKAAIVDSLLKAEEQRCASIAMPVLGCGTFGFSVRESCIAVIEAILEFTSDHQTSPRSVRNIFVVDPDVKMVEEFSMQAVELGFPNAAYPTRTPSQSSTQALKPNLKSDTSVRIRDVRVELKKGDITNETVQAIVNTTNREMDLKTGPLQGDTVAVTGGGNLQCNFIIHMMGPRSAAEARSRVKAVLERCEQKNIGTVSFPAVGTGGGGLQAIEAMTAMLEAFSDHLSQRSVTALKLVCVVVDRDEVLHEFQRGLKEWAEDVQEDEDEEDVYDEDLSFSEHQEDAEHIYLEPDVYLEDPELKTGTSDAQQKDKKMPKVFSNLIGKGAVKAVKGGVKWKEGTTQTMGSAQLHKKKKLNKASIGTPQNFQHIGHVGFKVDIQDPELKRLFDICGIGDAQLKDQKTIKVIYDFIEKRGGVEAIKEGLKTEAAPRRNQSTGIRLGGIPYECTGRWLHDYMHAVHYNNFPKHHVSVTKDCSGVVPDCHGVTQNGSGSSSVTSPALVLVETPNKSMCGGTVGGFSGLPLRFTRPEDLVSLHLHPCRTICRNCVRMFKLHGMDYHRTPLGTSTAPYRDVWPPRPAQPINKNPGPAKQPEGPATDTAAVAFPVTTVEVYGTSPADLAKVKKLLDDLISEECTSRDVQSPYLASIQEFDKEAIVALSQKNQVDIVMASPDTITVSGKKDDVLNAVLNISVFIQAAKEREALESEKKRLRETLCWEVAEGESWIPLDSSISYQLELAFHKKEESFTYEEDGEVYTVDFKELRRENSRGQSWKIKRTLIGDPDTAIIQPPPTWTTMKGRDLEVILLTPDSDEYERIGAVFLSSSQHPDLAPVQIVQIRRIQNKSQWQRYCVLKQAVDKKYPNQTNEQFLYHGTTKEICQKINSTGFNRSFCGRNAVAYGYGTYFAKDAYYSCQDKYSNPDENGLKYIYRARVVTGSQCKGRQGMKEPDPLDPKDPRDGLYDCAVDDLQNPSIYVVFCDAGAYPDYLIVFKST